MRDQSPKNEVHTFIHEDEIKKKRLFYVAKKVHNSKFHSCKIIAIQT